MKSLSVNLKLFLILICSSVLFCVIFFSNYLFYINDQLYVVLGDDAMISMRSAKHWADGYGIYWNKGGSPEAYTNFLLVCIMALVHLLFNPSVEIASFYITMFNYIIAILVILMSFKVSKQIFKNEEHYALLSSLLVGFSWQFTLWGVAGFETSLLSLFSIISIYFIINHAYLKSSIAMALAVLTRDDYVIFVFIFGTIFPLVKFRKINDRIITSIKISTIPLMFFMVHLLWRKYYYGDFLPNTYYLKVTGWIYSTRLREGLKYILGLTPVITSTLIALYYLYKISCNDNEKALFSTLFFLVIVYTFYNIHVGGDAFWGARFFASLFPVFAIAGAFLIKKYCHSTITIILMIILFIFYPLDKGLLYTGYHVLRSLTQIKNGFPISYDLSLETYTDKKNIPANENVNNIYSCQIIQQHAIKYNIANPSMAVYYGGVPPYMCYNFYAIDLLGKGDQYIASQKAHKGRVGHNKYDYEYSLGKYKPTYILSLMPSIYSLTDYGYLNTYSQYDWRFLAMSKEFKNNYSTNYLRGDYQPVFIRNDSLK